MEMIEEENDIVPGLDVTRQTQAGFKIDTPPISCFQGELGTLIRKPMIVFSKNRGLECKKRFEC